jgi:hypothetical protein
MLLDSTRQRTHPQQLQHNDEVCRQSVQLSADHVCKLQEPVPLGLIAQLRPAHAQDQVSAG